MTNLGLQSGGFAIVIDRRNETWQEAQSVLEKIVTIFPARVRWIPNKDLSFHFHLLLHFQLFQASI